MTLNLDGQNLVYFNNATRPQPMTWPGKDGTGVISLAFQPIDGSPEIMLNETGSWAWLRMLRGGRFTGTSLSDVYSLRLGDEGHVRRFPAQGGERRESLQPPDVQEILMSAADMILPGFYGKMPATGDFVTRRLTGEFVRALGPLAGAASGAAVWPGHLAAGHGAALSSRPEFLRRVGRHHPAKRRQGWPDNSP